MIPLKLIQGQLFDKAGNPVLPNENGIIIVEIEGTPRRFVYEKLVSFLERNGQVSDKPILRRRKPQYIKKGKIGEHRRKPVIVTTPEGKELRFDSCSHASKELNICRTNIPHVLSGKYKQINGYKIKYAS